MRYVIYALAGVSILLAIGGLGYKGLKKQWVILASIISFVFSFLAIAYTSFWPLIIGFGLNWSLRLLGLEPSISEVSRGLQDEE